MYTTAEYADAIKKQLQPWVQLVSEPEPPSEADLAAMWLKQYGNKNA